MSPHCSVLPAERARHFRVAGPQLLLRMRDVVTLHQIAAEVAAGLVFLDRLDPLGDRLRADLPRQLDQHLHQVLLDRLRGERRDERLRDLEVIG